MADKRQQDRKTYRTICRRAMAARDSVIMLVLRLSQNITYFLQEGNGRYERQNACPVAMGHHHVHTAAANDRYGVSILGVRRWEKNTYTLKGGQWQIQRRKTMSHAGCPAIGSQHVQSAKGQCGYSVSMLVLRITENITYVLREGQWRIQRQHACSAAMGDHHIPSAKVNDGNGVSILGVRRWENITYRLKEGNGRYSVSMLVLRLWDTITYMLRR